VGGFGKQALYKYYFKYIRNGTSPVVQTINNGLKQINKKNLYIKHAIAQKYPNIIKGDVKLISLALTSRCNLKCQGCSYGREFMPQENLSIEVIKETLDSIKEMGIPFVTLYGGEPTMIKSSLLIEVVSYATQLGLYVNLSTNAALLTPSLMDKLYAAGLRGMFIGIYGVGDDYNAYVNNRKDVFSQLDENIGYIRETYPDVSVDLGWLLMKPTCNLKSVKEITGFVQKHDIEFYVALVHYDFPYFTEGEDKELQLYEEDLPEINEVTQELIRLKKQFPEMITNTLAGLNSIPDWLIKKADIDVPCYRYQYLWVAANGEVRVCQKAALLGNVNDKRLSEILYSDDHTQSARDCFALKCSGCHVDYDMRVNQTPESRRQYQIEG
jgi:cyclic pyranopterin phosphate synthase